MLVWNRENDFVHELSARNVRQVFDAAQHFAGDSLSLVEKANHGAPGGTFPSQCGGQFSAYGPGTYNKHVSSVPAVSPSSGFDAGAKGTNTVFESERLKLYWNKAGRNLSLRALRIEWSGRGHSDQLQFITFDRDFHRTLNAFDGYDECLLATVRQNALQSVEAAAANSDALAERKKGTQCTGGFLFQKSAQIVNLA
jgi:hypothetical protein